MKASLRSNSGFWIHHDANLGHAIIDQRNPFNHALCCGVLSMLRIELVATVVGLGRKTIN